MNQKLKTEVWEKEKYYTLAEKGSLDTKHPGMRLLLEISKDKKNILDIGCGEGTRLYLLKSKNKNLTGIDISETAIKKAKRKYSDIKFLSGNIEKLLFPDAIFDLVYSAFVFEHLDEPERVIKEATRVLKKEGNLLIIAPNYGAPNRASPPFKGSRIVKLISGFLRDLFLKDTKKLNWRKVKPIANNDLYEMDLDTTIEPYLGSLTSYIKDNGMKIIKTSSSWEIEDGSINIMQKVFKFLGEAKIYPFYNWGPHLIILAEK